MLTDMPSPDWSSPSPASLRSFGTVFSVVGLLVAAWLVHDHQYTARGWMLGAASTAVSAVLWIVSRVKAAWLRWPAAMWFALGAFLHAVVSPITLGILFFLVLTPVAIVLRMAGRDALRLKRSSGLSSYWVKRDTTTPDADTLRRQF